MKTLRGQRGDGLSKNTLLDDRFSARRLRRSFGAPQNYQKFRKGVGGQRGLARGTLQRPEIQASFLYPFSYAPLGEWGHIFGELFGRFVVVANSSRPGFVCRQPLFETSGSYYRKLYSVIFLGE